MHSDISAAVRQEFHSRLGATLPHFAVSNELDTPPGSVLYRWAARDDLVFFLLLQFHRREEWFTVEIAWSRHGRWPATEVDRDPDLDSRKDTSRFRAGRLWAPPQEDIWWRLAPRVSVEAPLEGHFVAVPQDELRRRVPAAVDDAVQRLVQHAVPYFTRVAAHNV